LQRGYGNRNGDVVETLQALNLVSQAFDMVESVSCVFQRGYANRNGDVVERIQSLTLVAIKSEDIIVNLTTHEAARIWSPMLNYFDCCPSQYAIKTSRMSTHVEEDWVYNFGETNGARHLYSSKLRVKLTEK